MGSVVQHDARMGKALRVTSNGLSIAPGLPYEVWAEETANFLHLANMTPLYVGDAMIYGFANYSEAQVTAILTDIGKTKHTVENWISIARAIPRERRVDGLEAGHYDAIRGIKSKEGKPLVALQDEMIERAAREGWTVAKTRQEAADARDRAQGKLIDVPDDGKEEPDDDRPVMDAGAFGEGLSAERGEGSRPETDGFDDVERMRKTWAKMTPDLHVRFLRSIMTADLFMQIAPDFQQSREVREETRVVPGGVFATPAAAGDTPSSSRVELSAPKAAPCEAPANQAPAVSIPVQTPVGGGSHSEDSLEIPDFLKRAKEAV